MANKDLENEKLKLEIEELKKKKNGHKFIKGFMWGFLPGALAGGLFGGKD